MESIETIMEIKDNTFARQFETIVPEGLLSVEYSFQEKKIFLTKINTPEGFENQALINALLKNIMEVVIEKKFKLMPIHPKIVLFIKKTRSIKNCFLPEFGFRILHVKKKSCPKIFRTALFLFQIKKITSRFLS